MDPELFPSYCLVCDKHLCSVDDVYCSEGCRQHDSGAVQNISEPAKEIIMARSINNSLPTYPSVLDYYMDSRKQPDSYIHAPGLSASSSDDEEFDSEDDFSLPPSPVLHSTYATSITGLPGFGSQFTRAKISV